MTKNQSFFHRVMVLCDAGMNRIFGWRYNPLYQSGTLVVLSLLVMLVTGLYLLLFYRIGFPYESVATLAAQKWGGSWIRSLHRYASDLAIFAAVIHAVRMYLQSRVWGTRALAWLSGLFLVGLLYLCGWTGYVMAWDSQGQILAVEGARLLDKLPIFAERITKTFVGTAPVPAAFFFLNMFFHIAVPIGIGGFLWLHISRVARPVLLPPRGLLWATMGILVLVSVAWPAPLLPEADLLGLPDHIDLDVVYGFWVPLVRTLPPIAVWLGLGCLVGALVAVPWLRRPKEEDLVQPSFVEERFCTGCEQCYVDCPYDAIRMVGRSDGRDGIVGWVSQDLCARCGICAGSCAPMGVGPPTLTGRDQLREVKEFIRSVQPSTRQLVLVGCGRSATASPAVAALGQPVFPVTCVGNLHTSVIEYLVRSGAGGVLIASCPPRDCWGREGPKWMEQRIYFEREAELQERVDRERVRTVCYSEGEGRLLAKSITEFHEEIARMDHVAAEATIDLDVDCQAGEGLSGKGVEGL